jgi:hypothetical protein
MTSPVLPTLPFRVATHRFSIRRTRISAHCRDFAEHFEATFIELGHGRRAVVSIDDNFAVDCLRDGAIYVLPHAGSRSSGADS